MFYSKSIAANLKRNSVLIRLINWESVQIDNKVYTDHYHQRIGVKPAMLVIINHVALAKQGDNRFDSVHQVVTVCVSIGVFVWSLLFELFDLGPSSLEQRITITSLRNLYVCV